MSNMRLSQPDLPLLFLWLTTEGTEVGGPARMLTRPAAAWKPQADHLGQAGSHQHGVAKRSTTWR